MGKGIGYPLENAMVYYYSNIGDIHVYCGNDPLPTTTYLPFSELNNGRLKLRCRETLVNEFGTVITVGSYPTLPSYELESKASSKEKRTKERRIGYIIEKVGRWRKLYNGINNSKGELIRLTLEEAAN